MLEVVACPLCDARDAPSAAVASGVDYEYGSSSHVFNFVQCSRCGLVYLNPRPHVSELAAIYPPHYYSFVGGDEGNAFIGALRARWEASKIADYTRYVGRGDANILDVGCGRGRLLALMRRLSTSWNLYGIELDAEAVAAARANGFSVAQTTLEEYEPEARFDLIILQQVIEHVAQPRQVMRKIRGLLNPGGVVVIETPNLAGWDYRLFRSGAWGGYHFPRHWALFTPAQLKRLATEERFEIVEHQNLMSASFWSWSVHNVLQDRGAPAWIRRLLRPPNAVLLALTVPLELLQLLLGRETSNQRLALRRAAIATDDIHNG
jgi:methionine biosynthesis protein MetW